MYKALPTPGAIQAIKFVSSYLFSRPAASRTMVFQCQRDSYQQKFTTTLLQCDEPAPPTTVDAAASAASPPIRQLICADTILFPEGGGQPWDQGTLNGEPVLKVLRVGQQAVHYVQSSAPFTVGQPVELQLDWARRFDHMQQHSGQHLLTALLEQDYDWPTLSWHMGADTAYIKLKTPGPIAAERLREVEAKINGIISRGCEVRVETLEDISAADVSEQVTRATRGLPADHEGAIRIVHMGEIDSNMCCGTHVANLSQLQAVKLLQVEPKKTGALLHFVVGGRVLRYAQEALERSAQLNQVLACEPSEHVRMAVRWRDRQKEAQRTIKELRKQMAAMEARDVDREALPAGAGYYFCRRLDGMETDYLDALLQTVRKDVLVVGSTFADPAQTKGENWGRLVMQGRPEEAGELQARVFAALGSKGSGKAGRYQGKVLYDKQRLKEVERLVGEYFAEKRAVEKVAAMSVANGPE